MFLKVGTVEFDRAQRAAFAAGRLRRRWCREYPQLFEPQDAVLAEHQPAYHFYEWLAAIILHHATGYRSLVCKYQFAIHTRKRATLAKLLNPAVLNLLDALTIWGRTQGPDLLMYAPDHSDWFFCEAKGPHDTLSERQRTFFTALAEASGKAVRLLEFRPLRSSRVVSVNRASNFSLQRTGARVARSGR